VNYEPFVLAISKEDRFVALGTHHEILIFDIKTKQSLGKFNKKYSHSHGKDVFWSLFIL